MSVQCRYSVDQCRYSLHQCGYSVHQFGYITHQCEQSVGPHSDASRGVSTWVAEEATGKGCRQTAFSRRNSETWLNLLRFILLVFQKKGNKTNFYLKHNALQNKELFTICLSIFNKMRRREQEEEDQEEEEQQQEKEEEGEEGMPGTLGECGEVVWWDSGCTSLYCSSIYFTVLNYATLNCNMISCNTNHCTTHKSYNVFNTFTKD